MDAHFLEQQRAILSDKKKRYMKLDPQSRDPLWVGQKHSVAIPNIDAALLAIQNGTYGICTDCEEEIPLARLKATPGATRCVPCQKEADER